MKHSLGRVAVVLVAVLVLSAIAVQAGSMYTTWTGRYKIGETVAFKIVDSGGGWWSCGQCNTCGQSQILGWHIANSSGQTIYTVVHDAPVPSSSWQGTWTQVDGQWGSGRRWDLHTLCGHIGRHAYAVHQAVRSVQQLYVGLGLVL